MKIGIVGNAADKFTRLTAGIAKNAIREVIEEYRPSHVVSGACHLGGVDIWAEEIADELDVETIIHKPKSRDWTNGYKPRNLLIAHDSDIVVCIVASKYPKKYDGPHFAGCYHCEHQRPFHIKSGACWTAMQCGLSEWRIVSKSGWLAVPICGHFTPKGKIVSLARQSKLLRPIQRPR